MRTLILFLLVSVSFSSYAQQDGDTTLKSCPVFITDTSTVNNFFIEQMPSTVKTYRIKGNLAIEIQQKDQFFTLQFRVKKLKDDTYKIVNGANKNNMLDAKYSFRSGDQASFVAVRSGTVEASFDTEKQLWRLKVNGMIANLVETSVTYYKVRAEFYIR